MERQPAAKDQAMPFALSARSVAAVVLVIILVVGLSVLLRAEHHAPSGTATSRSFAEEPTTRPSGAHEKDAETLAETVPSVRGDGITRRPVFVVSNGPKPEGNASIVVPGLKSRAIAGDAAASFALWQWLEACHRQATRTNPDPSLDCTGGGATDFAERLPFLEFAAAHGEPNAVLQFPITAGMRFLGPDGQPDGTVIARDPEGYVQFRRNAMAYLEASALSGNVRALNALADAYSQGLLIQQDRVAALAYALAADRTGLSRGGGPWIERLTAPLSPTERQRADAQAREIFRRCCR